MQMGLEEKVALITGSHRGTGEIIAKQLQEEGAKVIFHGLTESDLQSFDENDLCVWGDIGTQSGSDQVLSQVRQLADTVHILVNNYGTAGRGGWQKSTSEDWIDLYEKNTLSAVRMIEGTLPLMMHAGYGRIVNLGTVGSTRPNTRMPHYYASKGALANLTISLMKELSGTGITVNLVSPGLIRTPEVEESFLVRGQKNGWGNTFEEIEHHIADNPLGRISTREEVADLVVFLSSNRASFINGQNIRIDGGALDIVQ